MLIGYLEDADIIVGELAYPYNLDDNGGNGIETYMCLDADIVEVQNVTIGSSASTISQPTPITFISGSTHLLGLIIYGNVGGVGTALSSNLFDEKYPFDNTNIITPILTYIPVYVGDGNFTLSTTMPLNDDDEAYLYLLSGDVSTGANTQQNGAWNGNIRSQSATDGYVTIAYVWDNDHHPKEYNVMLNSGTTALGYAKSQCQLDIVVHGKNMFDRTNAVILNGYANSSGVWVDDDNSKSIIIPCIASTDYTGFKISSDICTIASFQTSPNDQDTAISFVTGTSTDQVVTFNTGASSQFLVFSVSNSAETTALINDIIDSIMIVKSNNNSSNYDPDTDYEPYYYHTTTIIIDSPPLQSGKEYVVNHSDLPDVLVGTNTLRISSIIHPMCVFLRYIEGA